MSHGIVRCERCKAIVRQCRCPNHGEPTYVPSCKQCEGKPASDTTLAVVEKCTAHGKPIPCDLCAAGAFGFTGGAVAAYEAGVQKWSRPLTNQMADCVCADWTHVDEPKTAFEEGGHNPSCSRYKPPRWEPKEELLKVRLDYFSTMSGKWKYEGVAELPGPELHNVLDQLFDLFAQRKRPGLVDGDASEFMILVTLPKNHRTWPGGKQLIVPGITRPRR